MDLSLPRFTKLDDGVIPKTKPWPVETNPGLAGQLPPGVEIPSTEHLDRHTAEQEPEALDT